MTYRDAGLSLDVIGALLQADGASAPVVLERHLQKVNEDRQTPTATTRHRPTARRRAGAAK